MISEGRRSVPRSHTTSAAPRVVLPPLTDHDALISIQATPQTQSPLAVAAGFHRAMAAATGNQVTGGSPRPRPRPPEIGTCCGLSRPRRRRKAAGHEFPVILYMAAHHRASCLSRAGVRLGEENERVASSGVRGNLKTTPVRRGLRGRRFDGRAPDAEKLFWARNPSIKPARKLGLTSRSRRPKPIRADVVALLAAREPGTSRDPPENAKRKNYDQLGGQGETTPYRQSQ